jgi:ABC-type glutathione transport system ATPase component
MRADRVLVVKDGEIVEDGSHDELIRAKGRYYNLWSKQIFVKAADEQPRSRIPRKRDANFIGDMSRDRSSTTMAQVSHTVGNDGPAQVEGRNKPVEAQEPDKGPNHKREVSDGSE